MYSITSESAAHPDIVSLIAALDAYQSELYPAESNHLLDLTQLSTDSLIMMVIRDRQLKAVGCGAIVLNGDGTGEMKRVYIDPTHRGQQLGENCWPRWKTKRYLADAIRYAWKPASSSTPQCDCMKTTGTVCARRLPLTLLTR